MPGYVLIVDFFALILAFVGFSMAFRQTVVRRLLNRPELPRSQLREGDDTEDPLTYILRIAGIMVMVFGIVLGGMMTFIHLN